MDGRNAQRVAIKFCFKAYASFINLLRSDSRHVDRDTVLLVFVHKQSLTFSPQKYIASLFQTFAVFWNLYSFFLGGGGNSPASEFYVPTFRKTLSVPEDENDSVPKLRHINSDAGESDQKKGYKISTHLRKEANHTIIVMNCHHSLQHVSSTTTFTYRHCFAGRVLLTSTAYTLHQSYNYAHVLLHYSFVPQGNRFMH